MANAIETDLIIEAIAKGFDKASKQVAGLGTAGETAEKGLKKGNAGIGAMSVALGNLASGALQMAGRALVDFAKESVNVAVNMEETASLIDNSLGPAADSFREKIEAMAEATNRSAIELEAGSSTIIAMTRSMGLGQQAAADYSASMAQIATDLGSFFNKSTEDVFLDIQAALAGSSETMQKYGIDVRETQIKNKALEMGLISQGEAVDRVTRATVIQAEILRQASDAMGDAERTAGSASNTQRGLEAAMVDLQAAVGEALVPALTALATETIPAVVEATKIMVDVLTDAEPAIKAVGKAIGDTFRFGAEIVRVEQLAAQIRDVTGGWLSWGAIVPAVAKDLAGYKSGVVDTTKELELMELALDAVENGYVSNLDELTRYLRAKERDTDVAEAMNEAYKHLADTEFDLEEAIHGVTKATQEATRMTAEQTRAIARAEQENHTYEVSVDQVKEAEEKRQDALKKSIELLEQIAQIAAASAQKQVDAAGDLFDAYDDLAAAQGEYVTIYQDNSDEIAEIQSQLMSDLSDEQKDGLDEQLGDLDEYSAEAIGIWNQLQGDLTDTQRRELIARLADLQANQGEASQVYTGNAEDAEEAQRRISEAFALIKQNWQQMVLDIAAAKLSDVLGDDAMAVQLALIDIQEEMGTISSEHAEFMRTLIQNTGNAEGALNTLFDEFMADGILTQEEIAKVVAAMDQMGTTAVTSEGVLVQMGRVGVEEFQNLQSEIGNTSQSIVDMKDEAQEFVDDGPYEAVMDSNAAEAGSEIDILKGKADSTAGTYNIHYTVTSDPFPQPAGGGATGGGAGNLPGPDANVGPGFQHGAHFIVPPQFTNDSFHFRANAGEEVIVRTPAQQQSAGGGVTIENFTVIAQPGMDAEQVAEFAIRELGAEIKSRLNGRSFGGRF